MRKFIIQFISTIILILILYLFHVINQMSGIFAYTFISMSVLFSLCVLYTYFNRENIKNSMLIAFTIFIFGIWILFIAQKNPERLFREIILESVNKLTIEKSIELAKFKFNNCGYVQPEILIRKDNIFLSLNSMKCGNCTSITLNYINGNIVSGTLSED